MNSALFSIGNKKLIEGIDILVRDGIITVNEARELLDLEPLPIDEWTGMETLKRAAE